MFKLMKNSPKFSCLETLISEGLIFVQGGTLSQLQKLSLTKYTEVQIHRILRSIYIDFSKAFHTVKPILLHKLQHYGIRGTINDWYRGYLLNRTVINYLILYYHH